MLNKTWRKQIQTNFSNAAEQYSKYSLMQSYFAEEITFILKDLYIPNGYWVDLGAGTGILADAIENKFGDKKVCRVDFSAGMLKRNKKGSKTILFDLNNGFPLFIKDCSLIVSNFCLHWLLKPDESIREWFNHLKDGGYLIISYPTNNCFPEWKRICEENNFEYTGLKFPNSKEIRAIFKSDSQLISKEYKYKENFANIFELFRNFINLGAQTNNGKRNSIKHFKILEKQWNKGKDKTVNLTWEINILIIKK